MSRTVWVILAILAVAFAVITGLAVKRGLLGPQSQTAAIGGPFHLVDQTGAPRDADLLKKKWSAVFFGFTYCPEACPTTLLALGQTEKLLGPKADDFQTVFISVDPERDTPKVLANYLSNSAFPHRTLGLTGTSQQVADVAHAYHVFYQKAGTGPDYQINHSTITYLMSPSGDFVCVIPYGETPDAMAGQIRSAMKQGPHAQSCHA
ncbi:MAG TPA: SCO family protein [Phenylobacterium sp.]|jgi:protein SCO1/2|uniref:SCO family protein n=1 Tax=Phenylobacterium sp. TaxID=1871053 RepID=UPI002C715816|nr:SCO family protein [Phenylobacterium sp.]HXA41070.1 SCO family protein [Phenylobacterium sp.]